MNVEAQVVRTTKFVAIALIAGLMAACTSQGLHKNTGNGDEYSEALSDAQFTASERCLSGAEYDSVDVISDSRLLFRGIGDKVWVNELKTRCPGLETYDALQLEKQSTSFTNELDTVRGMDRQFFSWFEGPFCTLGKFHGVEKKATEVITDLTSR